MTKQTLTLIIFLPLICISYHLNIIKKLRINNDIKALNVRLIDEDDNQLGEKTIEEALLIAGQSELDLVEVAPKAKPPVCKILDYGKYLYRQNKIEQKHKRMQKQAEMKGIRITFRIDKHDLETKIKQARKFLESKNIVKITLTFKGRESAYSDIAKEKLDLFCNSLKDIATIEVAPKRQGNSMFTILAPLK